MPWIPMSTDNMIPVSDLLDKYDIRIRPVPLWVPIMQILAGIELSSMGTREFLNLIFFFLQNITFF